MGAVVVKHVSPRKGACLLCKMVLRKADDCNKQVFTAKKIQNVLSKIINNRSESVDSGS